MLIDLQLTSQFTSVTWIKYLQKLLICLGYSDFARSINSRICKVWGVQPDPTLLSSNPERSSNIVADCDVSNVPALLQCWGNQDQRAVLDNAEEVGGKEDGWTPHYLSHPYGIGTLHHHIVSSGGASTTLSLSYDYKENLPYL